MENIFIFLNTTFGSTIVNVVVGLTAIIVTIVVSLKQLKIIKLSYKVITHTPLLNRNINSIKILHEDTIIEDEITLLEIEIKNTGNVAIKKTDYEEELSISVGSTAKIISKHLKEKSPDDVLIDFLPEKCTDTKIYFEPALLNKKDSFVVTMLIANYDGYHKPAVRIPGLKEIRENNFIYKKSIVFLTISLIIMPITMSKLTLGGNLDLIIKIVGVGLITSVLSTLLRESKKDDQASLVTLLGLSIVLLWIVQLMGGLFHQVKSVFQLF